jgi:hypothetical protein
MQSFKMSTKLKIPQNFGQLYVIMGSLGSFGISITKLFPVQQGCF